MIEASLFIPLIIVAITQLIKKLLPSVEGWLTIIVALSVGALIGAIDTHIGVSNVTVAQGVVYGLGAIGLNILANKAGDRVG